MSVYKNWSNIRIITILKWYQIGLITNFQIEVHVNYPRHDRQPRRSLSQPRLDLTINTTKVEICFGNQTPSSTSNIFFQSNTSLTMSNRTPRQTDIWIPPSDSNINCINYCEPATSLNCFVCNFTPSFVIWVFIMFISY